MHAHEMLQNSHRNKQQHSTPRTNEREVQQQHEENERKAQRKPKFHLKLRKLSVFFAFPSKTLRQFSCCEGNFTLRSQQIYGKMPDFVLPCDKRRRTYVSNFDSSVTPYLRKNKIASVLVGNPPVVPESMETSQRMEIIWMMSYALGCSKTKRWNA